jgi:O-antigen/teichoic acid export membrane protein
MFKIKLFDFFKKNKNNFGLLFLTQITTTLFLLLNNIILTRYFDLNNFGFYKYILAVFSIGATFSLGGFSKSLLISSAKSFGGNFKSLTFKRFLTAILVSIPVTIVLYHNNHNYHLYIYFLIFFVFPFFTVQSHWKIWLEGNLSFKKYFKFSLLLQVALLVFSFALLLFKPIYSFGLISLIILKAIIENFYNYLINLKLNNKTKSNIVSKGYSYSIGEIFGATAWFNVMIINYFLDLKSVAFYSVVIVFPALLKNLFAMSNKILNKKIINLENTKELNVYFKKYFIVLIGFFSMFGLVGYFMIPYIIEVIYPPNYKAVSSLASIVFLLFSFNLPISYFSNALTLRGNTNFFNNYQLYNTIIQLSFLSVGLYYFGLNGIIIPYLGSLLFSNIFSIYNLKNI